MKKGHITRTQIITSIILRYLYLIPLIIMFKKSANRPPIIIDIRRVPGGYAVQQNQSYSLFQVRKITRTMYRPDLNQSNNLAMDSGAASTIIQPPSHLTIPSFASWFSPDQIHSIEKEYFPQFFQQGVDQLIFTFTVRNGRLYRYYRNSIIQIWRQNVKKYLSAAHCRRCLPGDASIIIRIHGFLQNWGLINLPSRQHSKGQVIKQAQPLNCYVCEDAKAEKYHITHIQDIIFQVCDNCFNQGLYPQEIKPEQFKQILSKNHLNPNSKLMSRSQLARLLDLLHGGGVSKEKDREIWLLAHKEFPYFTKEQIVFNFLRIPKIVSMNANIFENNQDLSTQDNHQQPANIFQDFHNPLQASIAVSYKLWKTSPQEYPILNSVFSAAEAHSKVLASQQEEKIEELCKMLLQISFSRLELKSLYIQEYEKLIQKKAEAQRLVMSNTFAESLKCNLRFLQKNTQPQILKGEGNGVQGQ